MKLFKTNNIGLIKKCQKFFFNFKLLSVKWTKCCKKFEAKYGESDNTVNK